MIDTKSPFYDLSQPSMQTEQFEIVVILEGIVETTGEWNDLHFQQSLSASQCLYDPFYDQYQLKGLTCFDGGPNNIMEAPSFTLVANLVLSQM